MDKLPKEGDDKGGMKSEKQGLIDAVAMARCGRKSSVCDAERAHEREGSGEEPGRRTCAAGCSGRDERDEREGLDGIPVPSHEPGVLSPKDA